MVRQGTSLGSIFEGQQIFYFDNTTNNYVLFYHAPVIFKPGDCLRAQGTIKKDYKGARYLDAENLFLVTNNKPIDKLYYPLCID